MKIKTLRFITLMALAISCLIHTSCVTSYDAYGRQRQTVDPVMAVGAAAVTGLVGYQVGRNSNSSNSRYSGYSGYSNPYYRNPYNRGYRQEITVNDPRHPGYAQHWGYNQNSGYNNYGY